MLSIQGLGFKLWFQLWSASRVQSADFDICLVVDIVYPAFQGFGNVGSWAAGKPQPL